MICQRELFIVAFNEASFPFAPTLFKVVSLHTKKTRNTELEACSLSEGNVTIIPHANRLQQERAGNNLMDNSRLGSLTE